MSRRVSSPAALAVGGAVAVLLVTAGPAHAQAAAPAVPTEQILQAKIDKLQAQVDALQAQIQSLRQSLNQTVLVPAAPAKPPVTLFSPPGQTYSLPNLLGPKTPLNGSPYLVVPPAPKSPGYSNIPDSRVTLLRQL